MIHAPETKKAAVFTFIAAVGPTGGSNIDYLINSAYRVSYVSQNA